MIDVRCHHSIFSLKKQWQTLQPEGQASVYQSYFVQKEIFKRMPVYMISDKYIPSYYEVRDEGKTVLIAPLCKYIRSGAYCHIGNFNGVQIYDFIYDKSIVKTNMARYLKAIFNKINAKTITLNNVSDHSEVYKALQSMTDQYAIQFESNPNVSIRFGKEYESYFNALSKHTRQNIRTAYNRIKNNDIDIRLEIHTGEKLEKNKLYQLVDLYCNRHEIRYGLKISKAKRWYLKHLDFSTACQQMYKDNFYAILYFGNNVAAFMSGMKDGYTDSIIIPRLCISDDYSWYSPGMVLINEVIKVLSKDNAIGGKLDLSKGDEKYKLSMGGEIYNTYKIIIN